MSKIKLSLLAAFEIDDEKLRRLSDDILPLSEEVQLVCACAKSHMSEYIAKLNKNLTIVNPQKDLTQSRNACLKSAEGEYILVIPDIGISSEAVMSILGNIGEKPDIIKLSGAKNTEISSFAVNRDIIDANGITFRYDIDGGDPVFIISCLSRAKSIRSISAKVPQYSGRRSGTIITDAAQAFIAVQKLCLASDNRDMLISYLDSCLDELSMILFEEYSKLTTNARDEIDWRGDFAAKLITEIVYKKYVGKLKGKRYTDITPKYAPEIIALSRRLGEETEKFNMVERSMSYRVGRVITSPLRKLLKRTEPPKPERYSLPPVPVIPYIRGEKAVTAQNDTADSPIDLRALTPYDPKAPFVTIVLPTYNVAQYLDMTISSIQSQTLRNFEAIFVDDGSSDTSVDIIAKYSFADSRIKLVRQKNQYAGVARNNGLENALGKYVCFLDPDDFFDGRMLEKCFAISEDLETDIVMYCADVYAETEKSFSYAHYLMLPSRLPQGKAFTGEDMGDEVFALLNPWTKFYRRSFIMDNNLRYQSLYSTNDAYFSMMAMSLAKRIAALPDVFTHYRINRAGSLQNTKVKHPNDVFEAFYKVKTDLAEKGLFEKFAEPFAKKAMESMLNTLDSLPEFSAAREFFYFLKTEGFEKLGLNDADFPNYELTEAEQLRYDRLKLISSKDFEEYLYIDSARLNSSINDLKLKISKK